MTAVPSHACKQRWWPGLTLTCSPSIAAPAAGDVVGGRRLLLSMSDHSGAITHKVVIYHNTTMHNKTRTHARTHTYTRKQNDHAGHESGTKSRCDKHTTRRPCAACGSEGECTPSTGPCGCAFHRYGSATKGRICGRPPATGPKFALQAHPPMFNKK